MAKSQDITSCSSQACTSPAPDGGHDCYAGSSKEGCTCSGGLEAHLTGNKIDYKGNYVARIT